MPQDYKSSARHNREEYERMAIEAGAEGGLVPPQATDLEEAVLGALLLENDAISTAQEYLTADSFYVEAHRTIYKAIDSLAQENKAIDLYTVTEALRSTKQLKSVGGAAYLAKLTNKVGSAANLEFHARIVAQKYVQRELIRAAIDIQRRSYDTETDVNNLIDFAEGEVLKITEGHVKRSVQYSSDILRRTIKKIEEASKNDSRFSGVCSGFTKLDELTLGWQPSDLIIIAARPSMGKTAFVLTMARNMALSYETPVAFFSLEMSDIQLMTRLIVAETGLPGTLIRSGKLSPEQWVLLESKTKPLGMAPLYIDDTPALSIFEFRSKARRLVAANGVKIIIVDYLQLMTAGDSKSKGNREQEVAFISRMLKAIAKELNVPIIALSQLSRQTEARGGTRRPQLSDLRESGAIEQDADVVAFIHRPEYYGMTEDDYHKPTEGLAEIIVAKHRNGAVEDVSLRFIKNEARFTDWDTVDAVSKESLEEYDTYNSSAGGGFGSSSSFGMMTGSSEFSVPGSKPIDSDPF